MALRWLGDCYKDKDTGQLFCGWWRWAVARCGRGIWLARSRCPSSDLEVALSVPCTWLHTRYAHDPLGG